MDRFLASIGAEIRRLRKKRGLTQTELGQSIAMNPNLLGRIERGQQNLTVQSLVWIAAGLEVRVEDLLLTCPAPRLSDLRQSL